MDSETDSDDPCNICPICNRSFVTIAGIKQHWSKSHSTSEIQSAIDQNSQVPVSSSVPLAPPAPNRPPSQMPNVALASRVTCRICNFLAKNDIGLKIHERIHVNQPILTSQQAPPPHFDINFQDEVHII